MRLVRPGAQGLFDLEITALDKNPQALTRTSSGGVILDEIRFLTGLTTRHVEFEGIPAAAAGDCMTNAARGSLWRRI